MICRSLEGFEIYFKVMENNGSWNGGTGVLRRIGERRTVSRCTLQTV
jgi:hypothetical protein